MTARLNSMVSVPMKEGAIGHDGNAFNPNIQEGKASKSLGI